MVIPSVIDKIVRKYTGDKDEFVSGYANLEGLLHKNYDGYSCGIVIGRKLDHNIIDLISDGPSQEYYLLYKKTNKELAAVVKQISSELNIHGISAMPVSPTIDEKEIDDKFSDTLRFDFSHKMAATRAGLGWIGKTDLLISRKFGPRVRLATVLVKEPLLSCTRPYNESKCGKCNICVDYCPAKAANGRLWDINVDRDEFFDAFKCRAQCRILSRRKLNIDISLCGICISVCPIGKNL